MTTHRYVSWFRRGLAASSGGPRTIDATVSLDGQIRTLPISLHGPGDIASLAPSAIVRRDPQPGSVGADPNGMAFVELAAADLPWRFSPDPSGPKVKPWLALVVVPAGDPFGREDGATLPVLTTHVRELPDPNDAWLWAHVQIEEPEGGLPGDVATFLRDHPDRAVARLLSPRRLAPQTAYRACLVPLFEAGRLVGLGKPPAPGLAWSGSADAEVKLPVYDSWLFETGDGDDFETIARRLKGVKADDVFHALALDVRVLLGEAAPVIATTYGVLQPPNATTALPRAADLASALEVIVTTDDAAAPAVGPPLYAAAQTGREALAGAPPWQRTLNLDPRRRAQAAAGAAIVRADQEQLVADASAALGELRRANTLVRGTQLATLLSHRLYDRHVASRPAARVFATLNPLVAGTPAAAKAGADAPALASAPMRRLARPSGPIARGRVAGTAWARIGHDLSLAVAAPPPLANAATPTAIARTTPTVTARTFTALAATELAELKAGGADIAAKSTTSETVVVTPAIDVAGVARAALSAVHPDGVAARLGARISGVSPALQELRPQIDLSRPLADRLVALHPELFVPGLADLAPDRVTVLAVDPAAVRAVLAGANDELSRELTWRGIQIDRSATLLRQLWARATRDPVGHDIDPIAGWTGELDAPDQDGPLTVFVIRSALIRRFPTALFTCVRAVPDPTAGRVPDRVGAPLLPLVRGLITPELAYVGFAKPLAELEGDPAWKAGATSDPGWYFAIQERPTHTRFGLDAPRPPESDATPSWQDLTWGDFAQVPYLASTTAPARTFAGATWGASSAQTAKIVERLAVRVAFHVRELLP